MQSKRTLLLTHPVVPNQRLIEREKEREIHHREEKEWIWQVCGLMTYGKKLTSIGQRRWA